MYQKYTLYCTRQNKKQSFHMLVSYDSFKIVYIIIMAKEISYILILAFVNESQK